jgi:hypothetical protein
VTKTFGATTAGSISTSTYRAARSAAIAQRRRQDDDHSPIMAILS